MLLRVKPLGFDSNFALKNFRKRASPFPRGEIPHPFCLSRFYERPREIWDVCWSPVLCHYCLAFNKQGRSGIQFLVVLQRWALA